MHAPAVGVECLELGEVAVECRHVASADAAERAHFEDIACGARVSISCSDLGVGAVRTRNGEVVETCAWARGIEPVLDDGELWRAMSHASDARRRACVRTLSVASSFEHFARSAGRASKARLSSLYDWGSDEGGMVRWG